jgi:predicted acyltransferase
MSIQSAQTVATSSATESDRSQIESTTSAASIAPRIASIDIFRGLTILVMIFVNDLAGVRGLPWWTYHLPADVNGMTYVDMVFPFFLFIVGISMPLAIRHRLAKDGSHAKLWVHIAARSFALLVLGIGLANFEKLDPRSTHIGGELWLTLLLVGAILFWNIYPRASRFKAFFIALKVVGFLLILAMFIIFRRVDHQGRIAWLDFGYWEILGLIGWTYLGVSILYLPTRQWRWAPVAWLAALIAFNAASTAHLVNFGDLLPFYLWPWSNGCFCLMTMTGIVTSTIFFSDCFAPSFKRKAAYSGAFAILLLITGALLSPLRISKIHATPTWALYSSAAATLCFLALYWICDVRKQTSWSLPIKAAGSNTLLTYLLPDIFFVTLGSLAFVNRWDFGWQGVVKSVIFTALMLLLATALTRAKLRLQL